MSKKEPRLWTVLSMLEWATEFFAAKQVPDPRLSIEWILAEALGVKRLDLYLQYDRPLSAEELDKIRPLVKRRADFEPLQYITGSSQFFNATILVSPEVLIPRIETEQLVDLLIRQNTADQKKTLRLLDIGTGSGCIPIALKIANPDWYCAGMDISEKAIELAKKNAQLNDADVDFFEGDFNSLDVNEKSSDPSWDIIISNPPYILHEEKTEMNRQVLEYEPALALFHKNPLQIYENIIRFASQKKAQLYLECSDKSAQKVKQITSRYFAGSDLYKDLDDNDRFIVASNALSNPPASFFTDH